VIRTDKRTLALIGVTGITIVAIISITIFSTRQTRGSIKGKIVEAIPAFGHVSSSFPITSVNWNYLFITFDDNSQIMFLVNSAENLETIYDLIQLDKTYLIEYSLYGNTPMIEKICEDA